MHLPGDDRAQSVVIGSLLIFTILILAFSAYQAFAVPNQNAQVESQHFQDVQAQFSELRSSVVNSVGSDQTRSAVVDLGPEYPSRILALNPPPASGSLETTDADRVEFADETNLCSGAGDPAPTSRSLVYTTRYNEFGEPVAVGYENRFVAREFESGVRFDDQRLVRSVDGGTDEINLILLNRSVSENGVNTYAFDIDGSTRHTRTVTNPTITLPSRYEDTTWEDDILGDRTDVTVSDAGQGRVELAFDGGDYEVSCAVVGLNGDPAFEPPGSDDEDRSTFDTRWIEADGEPIDDSTITANPGGNVTFTAEIRGRDSGNPVVDKPLSCDDVDIAGDTEAFESCDFPAGSTTNVQGRVDVDIEIAAGNAANDGDSLEVYITAGDDSDLVVMEVEEDSPPTATINDSRDNSDCDLNPAGNCEGNPDPDYAEFEVDWSATDDKGIQSVTLELVDDGDTVVDSTNPEASGTSASGTETLREEGGYGDDYTIRLTVTDSTGQEDIERRDVTADGNDP